MSSNQTVEPATVSALQSFDLARDSCSDYYSSHAIFASRSFDRQWRYNCAGQLRRLRQ